MPPRTPRRTFARLAPLALLAAALLVAPESGGATDDPELPVTWQQVESSTRDGRLEEAARLVEGLLAAARADGDDAEIARALVERTRLRIALGGYETAVEQLAAADWPRAPLAEVAVRLYLARALGQYQSAYAWEIRQRERVASDERLDLKLWTAEQIAAEARRQLAHVFARREALGEVPVGDFPYLQANDYPEGIRPTLRDAVSYLFAEELADSSRWSPAEEEAWRLDRAALLAGEGEVTGAALADPSAHPLARAAAILGDLERWHRQRKEPGAELEAKLERLRLVGQALSTDEDREAIRAELERTLPPFRHDPWWAVGQARLAALVQAGDSPDALIAARDLALEGERAYPDTYGGRACRRIREGIEAPAFGLAAMAADAPARRSLQITHANLERLYLRAYRLDVDRRLARKDFRGLFPAGEREIDALMHASEPAAAWTLPLPATPDYRRHRTYAVPPLEAKGAYLLVASARPDFYARAGNRLEAVGYNQTDLVLLSEPGNPTELRAVEGEDGSPAAGVEVVKYRQDWRTPPAELARWTTGADGSAQIPAYTGRGWNEFLIARRGEDVAFLDLRDGWRWRGDVVEATRSLVFTDRSLYRPGQTVHFKVLAFSGRADDGRLALLPAADLTVALVDPNGERVAEVQGATNDFGSYSGEFVVPAGRLLGDWRVEVAPSGSASIGVEEYKRPTFEATLERPAEEPRLNRSTALAGEARYYFGLPVTSGRVVWRVERIVQRPWWRRWGWGYPIDERPRPIAAGIASLDADGRFEVPFVPEADERQRDSGATYLFRTTVEITDDGGETRTAERSLRLGWVGVEAKLADAGDFHLAGRPISLELERTDLDGGPRAGEGAWRLVALVGPERSTLPAELPEPAAESAAAERYRTPGDRLRPRWAQAPDLAERLGAFADGREIAKGSLRHGDDGRGTIALGRLEPGAYRLRYETSDRFDERFSLAHDFVVAGETTPLAVPLALRLERASVEPGAAARVWVHSDRPGQTIYVERVRGESIQARWTLVAGRDGSWLEVPVAAEDRGGFALRAALVADHQLLVESAAVAVPWEDKGLDVTFSTFRDKLRPGSRERFTVTVRDHRGRPLGAGAAELVASMYDRSLDALRPFQVPLASSLYPTFGLGRGLESTLGAARGLWQYQREWYELTEVETLRPDGWLAIDPYGIGGPGVRFRRGPMLAERAVAMASPPPQPAQADESEITVIGEAPAAWDVSATKSGAPQEAAGEPAVELRSNFAETAFFEPHLLTGADGSVSIEFEVPDSVTSWKVWAAAATRDLALGYGERQAESVKELMVRPYLPRFLREGDRAELPVLVQNAGETPLAGEARLALLDPETHEDLTSAFGLAPEDLVRRFAVEPGGSAALAYSLATPKRLGPVAVRVEARAGDRSDGELRSLPILPARVRLAQSRFVALSGEERRELDFPDLRRDDPTRENDQMVVTVDGQLFYGMLDALPYLVDYPYECTEQTLDRFLSTGILSALFESYPAVREMAASLASRETRYERFDAPDPNRRIALEETPWLAASRGGEPDIEELLRVLDPRVAEAQRKSALARLEEAQLPSGAFPWFPGGPPSPWMTLYLLYGFGKASEFGVAVPEPMVRQGWSYLAREAHDHWIRDAERSDCCWEPITFLNYVASTYPDPDWIEPLLGAAERARLLDFSYRHWREHAPMLKLMLAMTLERAERGADARLVLASVLDSARTTRDEGTFWAPEDRAWLWYNDTIETHAWAIRALLEIAPEDPRLPGLVQWIFLNKKLNHWKSTRATAEVLYSLARYLQATGQLAVREAVTVEAGYETTTFVFEPDRFTGKRNQLVIPGAKLDASTSTVVASKETPGLAFVSATWHFSTEELPAEARGDLFRVERRYFRRIHAGDETVLEPLEEGSEIRVGDELEVQLSIAARAPAEYVHLRDPRPAGFEPVENASGWRYSGGLTAYQEIRDSGTNFFFEWLPQGEYRLEHRLRAATAGTFRAAPAELQSMYAPEFNGYSSGARVEVAERPR